MVILPFNLIALQYPGYFWDKENQKLYSIKVGGVLKEMRIKKPFRYRRRSIQVPHYVISHKGRRKYLLPENLNKLEVKDTIIPKVDKDGHVS